MITAMTIAIADLYFPHRTADNHESRKEDCVDVKPARQAACCSLRSVPRQPLRRGRQIAFLLLLILLSPGSWQGCTQKSEVIVVSKSMQQESNVNPGIPDEFAQSAPSALRLFWVEGSVRNTGSTEVQNVEIAFVATDGHNRTLMIATVGSIPPGRTVPFSTGRTPSNVTMRLVDEEPEIQFGR